VGRSFRNANHPTVVDSNHLPPRYSEPERCAEGGHSDPRLWGSN